VCQNVGAALAATNSTPTYAVTSTDAGYKVALVVSANNAAGTSGTVVAASALVPTPPQNTLAPSVSGAMVQGQILSGAAGTWTGASTITYQWQDCDSSGNNCASISGANGSTSSGATNLAYTLVAGDVGHTVRLAITANSVANGTNNVSSATPAQTVIVPGTQTAYSRAVLAAGPVEYYTLSDAAGTSSPADSSGNSLPGTNHGAVFGNTGPFSGAGAAAFASSGYITVPYPQLSSGTGFSVEGWVYWNGTGGTSQAIYAAYSTSTYNFGLSPNAVEGALGNRGALSWTISGPAYPQVMAATALSSGSWQYIAATEDSSGNLALYLNGSLWATGSGAPAPSSMPAGALFTLGSNTYWSALNGDLSDVGVYNKLLTPQQVTNHYNAAL